MIPAELQLPPFPAGLAHVFAWFGDLCGRRCGSGFGANPISYNELQAYFNFQRFSPTMFELDCLIDLDNIYLKTISANGN